jgi:CheY-like chemotaxis protein
MITMPDRANGIPVPRVFAIEDNPADARLVKEGIDEAGVELDLQIIHSGQRAIERLTRFDSTKPEAHPDLILLDLNLPGKSGFEVLSVIRNETTFPDVPVIAVSSSENPDDVRRVYELSGNAYVTKPVDPDEYIRMINAAVDFWIANVTPSPTGG